jgi:tetratricopeptide (TPR) repeat protein
MGYDEACRGKRLVLRFDTAELLEYEHDDPEVLKDCEIEGLEAPALEWLAEKAPQLRNTAIIIASRPDKHLCERLEKAYGENLQSLELERLNLEETKEYFQQAGDFGRQALESAPEIVEKVWLLADGRPIFVSLALDWLRRGRWDGGFYPVNVAKLREIRKTGNREWEEAKYGFEKALVQKIREWDTLLDKALYYAARARKGCNVEILAGMMGIPREEAEELMPQLLELSFVKRPYILPRWREQWFFLHDEMYDLVEEHVWQPFWRDYAEQERIAAGIIGYYNKELQLVEEKIRKAGTERERGDLQYQRQVLLTEQLYYQFDLNPQQGLVEYDRLDTQACSERARQWDNMLRIEALRFARQRAERAMYTDWVTIRDGKYKITDRVNMNCRVRWVHRYVAYGEHEKAIRVASKLLKQYPDADKLWQARLYLSRAAAEERLGRLGTNWLFDEMEEDVQEAIKLLAEVTLDELNEWPVQYHKTTAYVYVGLAASALGELERASQANEEAISLFRLIGYQAAEALALNNQAYILARQGNREEALNTCQKALKMRQEAGDERGIALSLNTLGIVKWMGGDYTGALIESLSALRIFQRRRDKRGIALARINLGRAYRNYGSSDLRKSPVEIEKYFKIAEDSLIQAKESGKILEPYYRIEVYNELGCTYKDWANFLALHRVNNEANRSSYYSLMEKADKEFGVADEIAGTALGVEKADNLEDWAWVYHLRYAYRDQMEEEKPQDLFQQATGMLDAAEEKLGGFQIRPEGGLEGHLYLGKVYFQRAHLMKFCEDRQEVARNYALAAAYLETYSEEAEELKQLLLAIEGWLGGFSEVEVGSLAGTMKNILDTQEREGWKCGALRRWIDDVILAAPTLGLGG